VLSPSVQYATPRNRDCDSINTATFEEHCKIQGGINSNIAGDALIVFADQLEMQSAPGKFKPLSLKARLLVWEECGEDNIKFKDKSRRMDPALKLYPRCPLMLNENINVLQGVANGTSKTGHDEIVP
jgi:hypothetical protein